MMDRTALKLAVSNVQVLPTLPVVKQRVSTVMDNPQSTIRDVSAVVSTDPVLTARLLQAVDWRRTIFADRVPTVHKAITAAGFETLRQLVRTQPVLDSVIVTSPSRDGAAFVLTDLWLHSVATAVAARSIAAHIGYPDPDECYVAALLHDVGKLVLQQLLPDRFYHTIAAAGELRTTFYQSEVESSQPSHAVIGQFLVEHWALPPKIIEVVWRHHTPQLAESFQKIVGIVHVADVFARALGLGSGGDPFVPPVKPAGLSAVGLRPAAIEEVLNELEAEFPRVAAPLL